MKVKKIKSDSIILHENSQVKLKTCGTCREIQFTAGVNTKCPIQNISKDKYLDKETGEMIDRVHNVNRCQSPKSMRKSIKKLMDLIRCNAVDSSKCKWLTLTYGEAMTDYKQIFEDGKMFLRRLQRYLNKQSNLLDG